MTVPSLDLPFRRPRLRPAFQIPLIILAALGVGLLLIRQPIPAGVAGAGLLALAFQVQVGARLPNYALGLIGVSLVGYTIPGKGYAYLGVPPLFIGEVALLLGLTATAPIWWRRFPLRHTSAVLGTLLLFMLVGALSTAPYLGHYGLDALRDAALWGYALFARVVASLVLQLGAFTRALESYGRKNPSDLARQVTTLLDDPARAHQLACAADESARRRFAPHRLATELSALLSETVHAAPAPRSYTR